MPNRTAVYKDPDTLALITSWWADRYAACTVTDYTSLNLYESYVSWCLVDTPANRLGIMPNYREFVKCLAICGIIEFAPNMWRLVSEYTPSVDKVRRITPPQEAQHNGR